MLPATRQCSGSALAPLPLAATTVALVTVPPVVRSLIAEGGIAMPDSWAHVSGVGRGQPCPLFSSRPSQRASAASSSARLPLLCACGSSAKAAAGANTEPEDNPTNRTPSMPLQERNTTPRFIAPPFVVARVVLGCDAPEQGGRGDTTRTTARHSAVRRNNVDLHEVRRFSD